MNDDSFDYFDVVIQADHCFGGTHFFVMTYVNRDYIHSENDETFDNPEAA